MSSPQYRDGLVHIPCLRALNLQPVDVLLQLSRQVRLWLSRRALRTRLGPCLLLALDLRARHLRLRLGLGAAGLARGLALQGALLLGQQALGLALALKRLQPLLFCVLFAALK